MTRFTNLAAKPQSRSFNAKGGTRSDLGRYMRSTMEANYFRYLRWLTSTGKIKDAQYEPKTFYFEGVRRNPISYTPDFLVTELNGKERYHEVKGFMDSVSRSKLKRMAKFYPEVEVILIQKAEYAAIGKWKSMIPGWE